MKQTIQDQSDDQASPAFFFNHLIRDRSWISGQANFIFQAHAPFHAPYGGPNSFHADGQNAASRTLTLYAGVRLLRFTELIANFDEAGGSGLSDGAGLAAYLNADAVTPRSAALSTSPALSFTTYNLQGYAAHVRTLAFINHAALGTYSEANQAYRSGRDPAPGITAHRHSGTVKPGFGVNFEQELPANFRVFFRAGWNDG